jgi:enoyl-CoA hydratase/carnithine racemase
MPEEYVDIIYEKRESIALITFNRPQKMNPIGLRALGELKEALKRSDDDDDIRCVILTGSGRAFCTGADTSELSSLGPESWLGRYPPPRQYQGLVDSIRELDKAVIAAINGWCVGGGYSLAMACDILVAGDDAMFYYPETAYGYPSPAFTSLMMWYTTPSWVKEILYCGRKVDAETALRIGLVNWVFPREQLLDKALAMAQEIAERPPRAIRMQKEMINRIWMHGWDAVMFSGIHTSVAAHADFSWQERMRDFKQVLKPGESPKS